MDDCNTKERVFYIDVLRVLAMIAVILNHSFGYFSCDNWTRYFNTKIYFVDIILNSITRFNVPIFIMISGALLLQSPQSTDIKHIWKERIRNVIIPFIVWTIIYIIVNCYRGGVNVLTKECIKALMRPRAYSYHLWYMYMLILLYAVTPLLYVIVNAGEKYLNYCLVFWIVFSIGYPLINHLCPQIEMKSFQNYNVAGGYIGYYLLGYRLSKCKTVSRKWCLIIFICSWIVTILASIGYQNHIRGYDGCFLAFLSPNIVFMSASLFLAIKNSVTGRRLNKYFKIVILQLSRLSFGIYLVHYMIRDLVKILITEGYVTEYIYIILSPILVFSVSVTVIYIVSRCKLLRFPIAGLTR